MTVVYFSLIACPDAGTTCRLWGAGPPAHHQPPLSIGCGFGGVAGLSIDSGAAQPASKKHAAIAESAKINICDFILRIFPRIRFNYNIHNFGLSNNHCKKRVNIARAMFGRSAKAGARENGGGNQNAA
jgi:hypothetical protein